MKKTTKKRELTLAAFGRSRASMRGDVSVAAMNQGRGMFPPRDPPPSTITRVKIVAIFSLNEVRPVEEWFGCGR